jgi:hypothetical protein
MRFGEKINPVITTTNRGKFVRSQIFFSMGTFSRTKSTSAVCHRTIVPIQSVNCRNEVGLPIASNYSNILVCIEENVSSD